MRFPSPLIVEGETLCCQPSLSGITELVPLDTDAGASASALFGGPPGALAWVGSNGGAGGFAFGICCAQSITLRFRGRLRMHQTGYDEIKVYLNDVLVWDAASSQTLGEAWNLFYDSGSPTSDALGYPYYEGTLGSEQEYHDEEIALETLPCGNVIKILCGYEDAYPISYDGMTLEGINAADARWSVEIIHLPPVIP